MSCSGTPFKLRLLQIKLIVTFQSQCIVLDIQGAVFPQVGLFHGGGWYSLGVQAAGVAAIIAWSAVVSFIILLVSSNTMHMLERIYIYMSTGLHFNALHQRHGAYT